MTAARKTASRRRKPAKAAARKPAARPARPRAKKAPAAAAPAGPEAVIADGADAFRDQAEQLIETMRETVETAHSRLESVNAEMFSLARAEMSDAVQFAQGLARARSFDDALDIQRQYLARVLEARVERARDLTAVSVEAAREVMAPLARRLDAAALDRFFPFARN